MTPPLTANAAPRWAKRDVERQSCIDHRIHQRHWVGYRHKTGIAMGATLAINGFGDADAIEQIVTDLSKTSNAPAKYYPTDMSDATAIDKMMADIANDLGPIDILINNAGIQHVSPVEDFPTDKWNAIIAINMSSVFHTTRAVVPAMKSNGWGRIINIASAHSLAASPFKSAYVAAKHGVGGFTKTTALETATHGITVNAISPGYVLTPLVSAQIPDTAQARGITVRKKSCATSYWPPNQPKNSSQSTTLPKWSPSFVGTPPKE